MKCNDNLMTAKDYKDILTLWGEAYGSNMDSIPI